MVIFDILYLLLLFFNKFHTGPAVDPQPTICIGPDPSS